MVVGAALKRKRPPADASAVADKPESVEHQPIVNMMDGANNAKKQRATKPRRQLEAGSLAPTDATGDDEVESAFCRVCKQTTEYADDSLYMCEAMDRNKSRYICTNAIHHSCGRYTIEPQCFFCPQCTTELTDVMTIIKDHLANLAEQPRKAKMQQFANALDLKVSTLRDFLRPSWSTKSGSVPPSATSDVWNRILHGRPEIAVASQLPM
jgi:hypothetical protein